MAPTASNKAEKCSNTFDNIEVGDIVEAQEKDIWYKAKVISVYQSSKQFRIHYSGWNKKWDKTVPFDTDIVQWISSKEAGAKQERAKFEVGQKVMAPFSDSNKYPAEILKVQEHNKTYTVKARVNKISAERVNSVTMKYAVDVAK